MPWVRLDDTFTEHPKIAALSAGAFRLHVEAICYSARNLTDGVIPDDALRRVSGARSATKYAQELHAIGAWERAENAWVIHDYLHFQPSREQVMSDREKARERKAKSRSSRRDSTRDKPPGHAVTPPPGHAVSHGGSHTTPTRPDPKPSSSPPADSSVTPSNGAASGGEEETREEFIEATLNACWELMADQTLERVRAEGQTVHNAAAWKRATIANLAEEHRAAALHHIGSRTAGMYYDLHVEVAEALDPRCGPADGGAKRASMKREATVAYLHPDQGAA